MTPRSTLLDLYSGLPGGTTRELDAGSTVFRTGDPVRHLFALVSGQVRLERVTPEGRILILHAVGPGESFAEAALFSDVFHCTATVPRPSRVLAVPKDRVLAAIRTDSGTAERFIGLLAFQVRALRTMLELRNILSARDRILNYLLLAAREDGEVTVRTHLKDLASELGLAHETLYRELALLEKDGLLVREGTRLRLTTPDPDD